METPVIKTRKGLSPIWILPLLALILGGLLLYKDYQESGFMITVKIMNANGLTAGKTKILFKGLPVGTLKSFTVSPGLQHIDANIEIVKEAKEELTVDSKIWIVRPEVSFNKITGLDTIVGGSYFEVQPGTSTVEAVSFIALNEAPPISKRAPGLHLALHSKHDVSLGPGSPVYYRKVEVGEIISNTLQDDSSIQTKILIYPKYMKHVNTKSLFYISEGITFEAKLPTFSLHLDPLKTIIRGGISFISPPEGKAITDTEKQRHLYKNHQAAKNADDHVVDLTFSVENGLQSGSEIHYNGVKIGSIRDLTLSDDMSTVHAKAYISQNLKKLIREDTYIYTVKVSFNTTGVANIGTIISGPYLNLISGHGKAAKHLAVHTSRPMNMTVKTGLNLVLETERLGSLGYDKPVYYRQVKVGHTTGYELSPTGQHVLVYINIHPAFTNLIRENSQFWNSSGIRIHGGLMTSMKISTESMATLLGGGISFSTPEENKGNRVSNGRHFILNTDPDEEWLTWSPALEIGEIPKELHPKKTPKKTKDVNRSTQ